MQRSTSTWVYFLSLMLGIAMTVALLPACSGGGSSSCNSPENMAEGNEVACAEEEAFEEDLADADAALHQLREEEGGPLRAEDEISQEIINCGLEFGCNEI